MSFGKMNTFIDIVEKTVSTDDEGFKSEDTTTIASVRAYCEGRHGSEKWANRAVFSEATDLFRFRAIPDVTVTTDMRIICGNRIFEITSVANVLEYGKRGRQRSLLLSLRRLPHGKTASRLWRTLSIRRQGYELTFRT